MLFNPHFIDAYHHIFCRTQDLLMVELWELSWIDDCPVEVTNGITLQHPQ